MQVVLLRVGIDTGSGGIHGPLFKDGSFEYVPIRDGFNGCGISDRTYGNTLSRYVNRRLVHYFPENVRESRRNVPITTTRSFRRSPMVIRLHPSKVSGNYRREICLSSMQDCRDGISNAPPRYISWGFSQWKQQD